MPAASETNTIVEPPPGFVGVLSKKERKKKKKLMAEASESRQDEAPTEPTPEDNADPAQALPPGLELGLLVGPPPGLAPPPGLERPPDATDVEVLSSSPAWKEQTVKTDEDIVVPLSEMEPNIPTLECEKFQVKITGLPNEILSDLMMEAVFQQAGFRDSVVSFDTTFGNTCGEVLVNLSSQLSAGLCAYHFHGCQWVAGEMVTAVVMPTIGTPTISDDNGFETSETCSAKEWVLGQEEDDIAISGAPPPGLGLGAPEFVPSSWSTMNVEPDYHVPWEVAPRIATLSAKAPVFTPSSFSLSAEAPCFIPGKKVESDASTETGESDPESENQGASEMPAVSRSSMIAAA